MAYNFDAALKAGTTPQQITNYLTSKGRAQEAETYFNIHQNNSQGLVSKAINGVGNYAKNVWSDFGNSAQNILKNIETVGNTPAASPTAPLTVEGTKAVGNMLIQNSGEAVNAVFAPLTELLKPIINKSADVLSNNETFQNIANSKPAVAVTDSVNAAGQDYQNWAQTNPNKAKDLEAAANTIMSIVGEKPIQSAVDTSLNAAKTGIDTVTSAAGDVVKGAAEKTGSALKSAGESAYGIGVGMEDPTKIALQSYQASQPTLMQRVKNFFSGEKAPGDLTKPTTEANTAARNGLVGTEWQLGVQAKKVAGDIWNNTISPALKASKDKLNMPSFLQDIENKILQNTADLTRRNDLLEALQKVKDDYKKVSNFKVEKLQNYKKDWAEFVPEASYKGKPIGSSLKAVHDMMAEQARSIIYDKLGPNVKQAYLDYGNLQSIEKAGIKSVDLLRSKGFTKQAWEFIMDKGVTPVSTTLGQILYKTGDGLEFLGQKGAKTVRDVVAPTTKP